MARRKKTVSHYDVSTLEKGTEDFAQKLGEAFATIIQNDYGTKIAPKPIMTPFGIKPLDALLGGGLVSSAPTMLSSTPETGKSTTAFQFAKIFQSTYPNSIVVYLDIEGSGNVSESTEFQTSRMESFGLDPRRFNYQAIMVDVLEVFNILKSLVEVKRAFEEKLQQEFYLLIIWDSIAATPSSRVNEVDDPNRIIGLKARQLTFALEKYAASLSFNRITFLAIDQVRANIKIDGPYVPTESSVGSFKDFKAASSIAALNHRLSQWAFLSKGKTISPTDGYTGIDGWFINVTTEKNKFAPSKHCITCVFDKSTGINKFWTEFHFLSEMTPGETKFYKNKKFPYPLFMKKSGAWYYLEVINPQTGEIGYKSEKFHKKNCLELYNTDPEFKKFFDYAVDLSIHQRIKEGMFKINMVNVDDIEEEDVSKEEILVEGILNEDQQQNQPIQEENTQEVIIVEQQTTLQEESIEKEGGYQTVF